MNTKLLLIVILLLSFFTPQRGEAQEVSMDVRREMGLFLDAIARKEVAIKAIQIDSVAVSARTLQLFANITCSYIPFREENVAAIYRGLKALLPPAFQKHTLQLYTNKRTIEELIPLHYRGVTDKKAKTFKPAAVTPLVRNLSAPYTPTKGLGGKHIALWQSHGYYYEQKLARWEWQRARIFQTVEDLYTQGYVLPYLVPMLEHAGAHVLLPRERDCQPLEVIADNDASPHTNAIYTETSGDNPWAQGTEEGFAYLHSPYTGTENPFREGSYRQVESLKKGKESVAQWTPHIPLAGAYAVYISYKTLPTSTNDALYTVYHKGGKTQFRVNQQMGGGTWIYLGTFSFEQGSSPKGCITLSNLSAKKGKTVTADAVKIGGGMGNIARTVAQEGITENNKSSNAEATPILSERAKVHYPLEASGYPRIREGARYWLQWAGVPDSVYSESKGKNDYTDDFKSRGLWVNYLAGGSSVHPTAKGLNIPIDMAFAFHSDAGTTRNDSIIGTLGIYHTDAYEGLFANGSSRYLSHDLTDLIQSSIVRDIRTLYEPTWSRRGKWNQSYFEARLPRVPTMLLELLSHQNFADMRYGLDPRFRFTVSRAIYKGMLQFICSQQRTDYVVQPLPVDHVALQPVGANEIELTWKPVDDPLEPTATADSYIIYTRIGDGAFDNGVAVPHPRYRTTLPEGLVCSYKVTAVNRGGQSFPSEILSAGRALQSKGMVLVVNGFDRISAPADFVAAPPADTLLAGFRDELDHGVPYLNDYSYIGSMKEFRRQMPWIDDDASGFGDSYSTHETKVIGGNTFDYPALHGEAILKAGYSFVSCSDEAVEENLVPLTNYAYTDLILGKECQTKMGRGGLYPLQFKTFSDTMQQAITRYCQQGGNLFVSGAYVGTDLWDNPLSPAREEDKAFATNILKYKWRVGQAAKGGQVKSVASPFPSLTGNYSYHNELTEESYVVESPDGIVPADSKAHTIMRYAENNISAGVAYAGDYKTVVLGFPFESLRTATEREQLMRGIMHFFQKPQPFRFAQLTDLHISPHNPSPADDLRRVVEEINQTDSLDFVLVTGDITEEGDRLSMQTVKSTLDLLTIKYYIVPGNHETKWSDSGVTAFSDLFGGERFELEHKGFLFLGFNSGPLMRMAYGHVVPQDLHWMKQTMERAGRDKPVLLVTHYPMLEGDVDNWYEVTDAVRPYNIRAFLGGHYHSNRNLRYDGIPGLLSRSTLRDKAGQVGYSLVSITADSLLISEKQVGQPSTPWAALSLTEGYYDRHGKADKYPDFTVNHDFPHVEEQWVVQTGVGIYSSPAVANDRLYVGDDGGILTCYALKDGQKQWSFAAKGRIVGTPAVADNVVVFGSADRTIYGLEAGGGKLLWTVQAQAPVLGAVTIENGIAYIGASDQTFRAIHLHSGQIAWAYTGVKGYVETKPLLTADKVIFGAWDNTLYALLKTDGSECWKWQGIDRGGTHYSPAAVWPVAANGKVFIADPRRILTAIDETTGTTVWSTAQSKVRETIGLSQDGERIYSKTMNDSIVCFSAKDNLPIQLWATDVGFGYEHAPSMPLEKDNVLFGSTKEGLIFALNATTGHVLWKHKVGNSLINTVTPLSGQQVLFTATSGEVGLLRACNKE